MKLTTILTTLALLVSQSLAFITPSTRIVSARSSFKDVSSSPLPKLNQNYLRHSQELRLVQDMEVIALVAGQENYGLAIVALGEAIWSFAEAPSVSHAKVLIPATIAAIVLVVVSGPMVTNAADPASIKLGLEIATGVSLGLGASYVARLLSPYSPSAKEIAFGGLLVAVAGFFSFSQNLVVDEFVQLPNLPLPEINIFPENFFFGL
eukprot:scaffold2012_cov181-Chaetoceros_neogracile.AAC.4